MGDAGAPSSSCSPRPSRSALEAASSGPAGAALPAEDCSTVPSSSPSLTGGEFLLHLLKRSPQCRGDAPPPLLSAHGEAGGGHGDPAVAVVGPSIPFRPSPPGGFPPSTTADAHPYGPPPWAEPCYPRLHQAQWGPPPPQPPEFGLQRSQPPPTGVQNQRRYTQYHNQNSASKQAGIITAFSPPLGFLGGPLDARDLQWNPGRGQHPPHLHYHQSYHHQHQQASQRDSSSMERLPLLFGSFASSSGDLPQCDAVLLKKADTSFRGGHIRSGILDRQHIAPNTKRELVPDSRPSLVGRGFTDSSWTSQLKMQQRHSRPNQSGDSMKKGQDCSSRQRFGKAEPGKPLSPQKSQDARKRVPVLSNGRSGEDTCEEQAERQRGGPRNLSCHTEPKLSRHLEPAMMVGHSSSSSQREIRVPPSDDGECMEHLHSTNIPRTQKATLVSDDESEAPICSSDSTKRDSELSEQLFGSLVLSDQISEKTVEVYLHASRGKDYRSDFSRGHHVLSQRMRIRRRELRCPHNLARFAPSLLATYESLKPSEEEKAKQRQLLQSLEKLVNKEWPNAQLYLYGSCANSFGVSNSDIDVCLVLDENGSNKSDIILKLAELFQSDNLQNVQALTRARVPIVKLREPVTGISCDICINNTLAVVNTKLLRDYAQIDDRLQQLAFLVKHWAKRRGVNDTYQGTLSSYAYVLMCIHFLQLRKPPILPCLQVMEATYFVTVDDIKCTFFDQVEKLRDFGFANKENVAELLWAFFSYWAYHHDYAYDVISVRTGGIISKESKNWTRRVGNDRHLICIEDPFELSHDLGRVVDKYTIKILREEFERAAYIMQFDPNPGAKLFELYVRPSETGLIV